MLPNYQARSPFVLKHTTSLYIWTTYVILYFDPRVFCVSHVVDPVPNCTKQNPLVYPSVTRITLEIELFTVLNSFGGCSSNLKLKGLPFLFELVAVVSQCALCHGYKPCATVFT